MCMLDELLRAKRDEIYAIAREHKAEKLWVLGSCARKEEYGRNQVRARTPLSHRQMTLQGGK